MDKREFLDRYEARGSESDFVQARRLSRSALAERPDDPILLNDYGYLLQSHGLRAIRAAADAYRRAIELDPGWGKPRFQLITALAALREPEQAIETYQTRLAAAPDDPMEHAYLAAAYLTADRFGEAERVARDGLRLAPDDARLTNILGESLAGEGKSDEALEQWRRGFALDPDSLEGRYGSAFLLEREGRIPEAIAEWRSILDWGEQRGYALDAEWPRREIARLEASASPA
jgi:tetratricopeptide (TPR) repeat protein